MQCIASTAACSSLAQHRFSTCQIRNQDMGEVSTLSPAMTAHDDAAHRQLVRAKGDSDLVPSLLCLGHGLHRKQLKPTALSFGIAAVAP